MFIKTNSEVKVAGCAKNSPARRTQPEDSPSRNIQRKFPPEDKAFLGKRYLSTHIYLGAVVSYKVHKYRRSM